MVKQYEGFTKQDLKDRQDALQKEMNDLNSAIFNTVMEIQHISKLLEKKK